MPLYNVLAYREFVCKFERVEALTARDAALLVSQYPTTEAVSIDDIESGTAAATVDLIGDDDLEHSVTFAFDTEGKVIAPSHVEPNGKEVERAFVEQISRFTRDGENNFEMNADDAIEALDGLILQARRLCAAPPIDSLDCLPDAVAAAILSH